MFLTCKDLAVRIGRAGQERLLGDVLDRVRILCRDLGLRDVATMVVSKDSLAAGLAQPAQGSKEKYDGWRGLRAEQARVMTFDCARWVDR